MVGYCSVGDVALKANVAYIPPNTGASMVSASAGVHPTGFVWKAAENQNGGVNYFEPQCPPNYVSVGHVAVQAPEKSPHKTPPTNSVCCVPASIACAFKGKTGLDKQLWHDGGTGGADNVLYPRKDMRTFIADATNCAGRFSAPCTTYYASSKFRETAFSATMIVSSFKSLFKE